MSVFYCHSCGRNVDADWVNYYICEKCNREFCEDHWNEMLDEEQDDYEHELCGDCYRKQKGDGDASS